LVVSYFIVNVVIVVDVVDVVDVNVNVVVDAMLMMEEEEHA
jgi:hypothetical protein